MLNGLYRSFISVPKVHPLVNSLDELPDSHLNWLVRRGTALEYLFLVTNSKYIINHPVTLFKADFNFAPGGGKGHFPHNWEWIATASGMESQ